MRGIGAMIHSLCGGSPHSASEYIGAIITDALITDDAVVLTLSSGKKIKIFDDGQSCCEHRYMGTDDDISSLIGHKLARIDAKDGPEEEWEYGDVHETCFVEIGTDQGFVTVVNHNEHNGYYGGFWLSIVEVE